MNVAQAINANHKRAERERNAKLVEEIRATNHEIRRLMRALPFCDKCGHRVLRSNPCEHLAEMNDGS